MRGYFTALEGLVGVGEQCDTLHLLGLSLPNICECILRYGGMRT